jgi:ADP-heptose:LPS heptosyltransferase
MSWMLTDRAPAPDLILGRSTIHSVEQQLALLSWSGVSWPRSRPPLSLTVSPEAEARVIEKLQRQVDSGEGDVVASGFACLVPGAALESKRWSAQGFAAVANHLTRRWNLPSVVIAGPGQEKLAREVASKCRINPPVLTDLSLKELIALLSLARMFIGNDSGPMHIAAALARPIVVVWGSSDRTVWHPWTEAPYRLVAHEHEPSTGRGGEGAIKQISSNRVIEAVDEVLEAGLEANHNAATARQAHRVRIDI